MIEWIECMNRWNEYGMYVFNEGRRSWRGERGGRKGKTFFVYMRGIGWGPKIDCIVVLFVCVGFLFGKLIFLIIPDSVLFFSFYFLFFCFFSSYGSIHVVYSS